MYPGAACTKQSQMYNVNDWRGKSVVRVTFRRDIHTWELVRVPTLIRPKVFITLTKWIYRQIWERCRNTVVNPVLFYCWPTVYNDEPALVGNHIQCYPNIETISGNRLVFAGKLTVHCVGHPRVHQARLIMTDVWRIQRSCLLLVSLDVPSSKLLFFKWILYFYYSTGVFCASNSYSVLT